MNPPGPPGAASLQPSPSPPPQEPGRVAARLQLVKPGATYALLGFTALVFLLQLACTQILGQDVLLEFGAKVNALIRQGEYWRLITPIFLHAGLLHVGFNLYALYVLGPQAEGPMGHLRFLLVYLLSGFGGVLASFAFSQDASVGASGAIFGILGALLVFFYRHRQSFGAWGRRGLTQLLLVAGINLLIGLSPGIDDWGHLGGLLTGILLAEVLGPELKVELDPITLQPVVSDRRPLRRTWPLGLLTGMGLALLAGMLALH